MDVPAQCLVCGAADSDAVAHFCCESCGDIDALTIVCRQCAVVSRYVAEDEMRALSAMLSVGILGPGIVVIMPYCASCIEIVPQRPIGEVEVYAISQK